MNAVKGIFWMLVTTILFAVVTALVRYLGSDLPASVSAFIRYGLSTVFMIPLILHHFIREASPQRLKLYGFRGLTHGLGVILWFFAMARLPVAEVTAIGYMSPIFVTLAAVFVFGERLYFRRITALLAGFGGMVLIVRPDMGGIQIGQLAMVMAAALFAVSYLLAKHISGIDKPLVVLAGLGAGVTMTLAPFAAWHWVTPTLEETAWLALVALLATLGHFTMTLALKLAPLNVTQPVNYLQLVWATLIGYSYFGETIDAWFISGAAMIILSTAYISLREQQLAIRQPKPPLQP